MALREKVRYNGDGREGLAIKVCSFNVNSIRAREELFFDWLEKREQDIDVLCLQELKVEESLFPWKAFEERGYSCLVFGQKAYNGVAVCTRGEAGEAFRGFGHEKWDQQKRLAGCKTGGVRVLSAYVPRGGERGTDKHGYKLDWYKYLRGFLEENFSPDEPLLLAGDFNVALKDRDVYDPAHLKDVIGTMPEEREALQEILDWGLTDAFRSLYPEEPGFTWWSYMAGDIWKDRGMRLDYLLCTPPLAERLKGAEVDMWPRRRRKPTPSDHAPLIAEFV